METIDVPYPAELRIVHRRPRAGRAFLLLLALLAAASLVLVGRANPAGPSRPVARPSPVAHIVPRPAAPKLSATVNGKTYACTIPAPAPTRHHG